MSGPSSGELRDAIGRWLQEALDAQPQREEAFRERFAAHLGTDPLELPIVSERFDPAEHPNLQVALDRYTEGCSVVPVGVTGQHKQFSGIGLSDLLASDGSQTSPRPGPVDFVMLPVGPDETMRCIQFGGLLVSGREGRLVLFVRGPAEHQPQTHISLEVMSPDPALSEATLSEVRRLMGTCNVYRGKVIGFSFGPWGDFGIQFPTLPRVEREEVILPEATIEALERHTLGMDRHRPALLEAGRPLKRGLLLYGPPGTGKTHSLAYLISQMPERTVIILTGQGLGAVGRAFALARQLAPTTVVLEDVDLVAMARDLPGMEVNPLLFELLNRMDGLAEDTDLIVALTTNRVDLLEPALAARPGRIDQAVETPIPDADARRRLFELYGRGIDLRLERVDDHIRNTDGVSPAFIKELMRRAALAALEQTGSGVVDDRILESAVDEMLVTRVNILGALLGADPGAGAGERG